MSTLFTADEIARLGRPHVARAWFVELDLPAGLQRFHSSYGTVVVGGHEWRGVSDPVSGPIVAMENVEQPTFGQAAAVTITLSGVNREFLQSVHSSARDVEGRRAEIYWAAFDGETQEVIIGLKKLFPRGRMSAPSIKWGGMGVRTMSLTIESLWSSQNFPPAGKWNGAGQRRRYPGDLGLDYVGVKVEENWV